MKSVIFDHVYDATSSLIFFQVLTCLFSSEYFTLQIVVFYGLLITHVQV